MAKCSHHYPTGIPKSGIPILPHPPFFPALPAPIPLCWGWGCSSESLLRYCPESVRNSSREKGFYCNSHKFVFVLTYSLTCRKTPAQYFSLLLPVLIDWIKQPHFSLNCQTSNILSLTLFKIKVTTRRNHCLINWTRTEKFPASRTPAAEISSPQGQTQIISISL